MIVEKVKSWFKIWPEISYSFGFVFTTVRLILGEMPAEVH